ncbi:MAG: hypothetical protein HY042_01915 [Spirochaetia bacterium]|nr:hypothetical protein [Spirochaetia bacterium]
MKFSKLVGIAVLTAAFAVQCGGGGGSTKEDKAAVNMEQDCLGGKIISIGEAPIFTGVDSAKMKAKEDACRNAISKCIGDQVASSSGVADGQSITSEIFSSSQGLCKNDQLIDSKEYMLDQVKMLKATFRFEVKAADISAKIDTMQKLVGNPKVMVLIREEINYKGRAKTVNGFTSQDGVAAATLIDFLTKKGYSVIPASRIAGSTGNEQIMADNPDETPATLKEKAAEAGADVLIIGKITVKPQLDKLMKEVGGGNFVSYTVTGTTTALTLWGKGKVLSTFTKSGNGAGVTDEKAAAQALRTFAVGNEDNPIKKPGNLAKELHSTFQDTWANMTRNNEIIIKVKGVDQSVAGTFMEDLKERTSVKTYNQVKSEGTNHEFEVTFPGKSYALAELLGFYKERPDMITALKKAGPGYKLRIEKSDRGEISVVFEK